MDKAIRKFLREAADEMIVDEKRIEIVFKHGKETIRAGFEGKNRYINALKEFAKHL